MANTAVTSGAVLTAAKENEITSGNSAPGTPVLGQLWLDTGATPPLIKQYDGASWQIYTYVGYESLWKRQGSLLAEQTITNQTAVEVAAITGLSIAVTQRIKINFKYRRTTGSATACYIGLRLNTTTVNTPAFPGGLVKLLSNSNITGEAEITIGPRAINYLGLYSGLFTCSITEDTIPAPGGPMFSTADCPNATITAVRIYGTAPSGATLGIYGLEVWATPVIS